MKYGEQHSIVIWPLSFRERQSWLGLPVVSKLAVPTTMRTIQKPSPRWICLWKSIALNLEPQRYPYFQSLLFPIRLVITFETNIDTSTLRCGPPYHQDPTSSPVACLLSSWFFFCDLYFASSPPQCWQLWYLTLELFKFQGDFKLSMTEHLNNVIQFISYL